LVVPVSRKELRLTRGMLHFGKLGVYLKPVMEQLLTQERYSNREFGRVHNPVEGKVEEGDVLAFGRLGASSSQKKKITTQQDVVLAER